MQTTREHPIGSLAYWDAVAERLAAVRQVAQEFADRVRDHFGPRLQAVRLYGSLVRGDWHEESDVDLAILLDTVTAEDRSWIHDLANRFGLLEHGLVLSTIIMPMSQYELLRGRERRWALDVEREGVAL